MIKYVNYCDGMIDSLSFYDNNRGFSNNNGPAYIEYYWDSGHPSIVSFYIKDQVHRLNNPAEYGFHFGKFEISYTEFYINDIIFKNKKDFNKGMILLNIS